LLSQTLLSEDKTPENWRGYAVTLVRYKRSAH